MTDATIRMRKFMRNPLLQRRQCIIDVIHPGKANVAKADLKQNIAKLLKVKDPQCVMLFGIRTKFGGGKSTGFALIYDTLDALVRYEPRHRCVRAGLIEPKAVTSRNQRKTKKLDDKKKRGTGRRAALHKQKRSGE
jgi:small subunit ribosomal protein S24e